MAFKITKFGKKIILLLIDKLIIVIIIAFISYYFTTKTKKIDAAIKEKEEEIKHTRLKKIKELESLNASNLEIYKKEIEKEREYSKLLLNKQLEAFKSTRNFKLELDKMRVLKMAESWEHVYLLDYKLDKFLSKYKEFIKLTDSKSPNEDKAHEDMKALGKEYDSFVDSTLFIIKKNEFYIGEIQSESIKSYIILGRDYFHVVSEGDTLKIKKTQKERKLLRMNLIKVRNQYIAQYN